MTIPSWAGVTTSQPVALAQQRLGVLGERDPVRDRRAERVEPEHAHRQPQLQRAGAARELGAAVAEVHRAAAGVAQVGALERERALEQAGLAHEHAADLVGLEEPLVRVEHERVGEPEPVERGRAASRSAPPGAP